jgi:hypothetical protein
MLEAKLKGEGLHAEETADEPDRSNVIDLMAALKASLQRGAEADTPRSAAAVQDQPDARPAPGAKASKKPRTAAQAATKSPRKRA